MKNYELTYIISSDLTEQEINNLSLKITAFIQEESGSLEKITKSSKNKLAYSIKKKGEGFLNVLDFYLIPEKLENLKKKLDSEKQILRYMILTKKPLKKTRFKEVLTKKTKFQEAAEQHPEAKKVELEEIDKKIDEILQE